MFVVPSLFRILVHAKISAVFSLANIAKTKLRKARSTILVVSFSVSYLDAIKIKVRILLKPIEVSMPADHSCRLSLV